MTPGPWRRGSLEAQRRWEGRAQAERKPQVGGFEVLEDLNEQRWDRCLGGVARGKALETLILPLSPRVRGQPSLLCPAPSLPSSCLPGWAGGRVARPGGAGEGVLEVMEPHPWEALGVGGAVRHPSWRVGVGQSLSSHRNAQLLFA